MTEAEWEDCTDPEKMLEFLKGKASDRKLRLFSCGCRRSIWKLLPFDTDREAIVEVERLVDESGGCELLALAELQPGISSFGPYFKTYWASERANDANVQFVAESLAFQAAIFVSIDSWGGADGEVTGGSRGLADECSEKRFQANLLRHIIGNPFRPYPAPDHWPSTVVQLATALYNGQDCSFALHDALLEAGHVELAEHFKEKDHPKGCWAVDMILCKK